MEPYEERALPGREGVEHAKGLRWDHVLEGQHQGQASVEGASRRTGGSKAGEVGRDQITWGHLGQSLDFQNFPSCGKKPLEGLKGSFVCCMDNNLRTSFKAGRSVKRPLEMSDHSVSVEVVRGNIHYHLYKNPVACIYFLNQGVFMGQTHRI